MSWALGGNPNFVISVPLMAVLGSKCLMSIYMSQNSFQRPYCGGEFKGLLNLGRLTMAYQPEKGFIV
jgi:hypothetical protein